MNNLEYDAHPITIDDIVNRYNTKKLNLSPGFQRKSVWKTADRRKLIESISQNYPLPSIFLYKREADGKIVYDVIDGKQRLESILMFMGVMRGNRFDVRLEPPDSEGKEWYTWKKICKAGFQGKFNGYKLQIIEVEGDTGDIIDLFIRINSTGKALSSQEKRHARYFNSVFLKEVGKLAKRYEKYFLKEKILSPSQISRMKHIELMCELLISVNQGDVINKKAALDRVMESKSFDGRQLRKATRKLVTAINRLKRMFPGLHKTRFRQISDFYSLCVLISKFESEGLILNDPKRVGLARELLVAFSTGVDMVKTYQKNVKGIKRGQETYKEYLTTVSRGTDEISQRRRREEILRGLLENLFKRKDSERSFSAEQRRIIWNTSASRKCQLCGKPVTWKDFTADHIRPHSKGGQSRLKNAAITHRSCNSSKGNRRTK